MFKKFLLTGGILASSVTMAFADPAPYIGANLGIVNNTSSNAATAPGISEPANFRGVPVSLFAGYGGVVIQDFYLAGEAFGTLGTAEISNNNHLKTTYGYGISIIPGMMLSDHTLAFVRAGVVRSRFSEASKTVTGGQVGAGLQTSLTQNIDLRGEYDFTAYNKFDNAYGNVSTPRSDAFNLGLVYKFD